MIELFNVHLNRKTFRTPNVRNHVFLSGRTDNFDLCRTVILKDNTVPGPCIGYTVACEREETASSVDWDQTGQVAAADKRRASFLLREKDVLFCHHIQSKWRHQHCTQCSRTVPLSETTTLVPAVCWNSRDQRESSWSFWSYDSVNIVRGGGEKYLQRWLTRKLKTQPVGDPTRKDLKKELQIAKKDHNAFQILMIFAKFM